MKVARKRGRKLNSRHSGRCHRTQETAEWRRAFETFKTVFDTRPVAVDVLTDKMNLFVAESLQIPHFGNDLTCGPAAFAATRIRDDAKRTKLVAAFDDGNESDVWRMSFGW